MNKGTASYNLYLDSTRTRIWGDGTGGTFVQAGVGTGNAIHYTIYGRVPARQNVGAGFFNDALSVSVVW